MYLREQWNVLPSLEAGVAASKLIHPMKFGYIEARRAGRVIAPGVSPGKRIDKN
jgi:hypothetical protein